MALLFSAHDTLKIDWVCLPSPSPRLARAGAAGVPPLLSKVLPGSEPSPVVLGGVAEGAGAGQPQGQAASPATGKGALELAGKLLPASHKI